MICRVRTFHIIVCETVIRNLGIATFVEDDSIVHASFARNQSVFINDHPSLGGF